MKRLLFIVLLLSAASVSGRVVTDMAGRRVSVPDSIQRVFTDRFVSLMAFALDETFLCNATFSVPEAGRRYISQAYYSGKILTEDNEEEILRLRPDVLLMSEVDAGTAKEADRRQAKLKIPVLVVKFGIADYRSAYLFLGEALNRRTAAARIVQFLDTYLIPLNEKTKALSADARPALYYAEGNRGLNTEAAGTFHSQVFDWLNARNVAQVRTGSIHGMAAVTIEQILKWQPEIVVVWSGFPAGMGLPTTAKKEQTTAEFILSDPVWAKVQAVKNGRVYQVPALPFGWIDRPPSTNCIAGALWLAGVLYPDLFSFDINEALREYFSLFYHTEVSERDMNFFTKK
ncbi:MAG: ABC transporter substrate-binding protein [Bacteroidales bacterium]|jgi:iron complex transport system substrate-binding protein|nr:ABC transporter substrate-binding protein [Bacteroidales bacterium]